MVNKEKRGVDVLLFTGSSCAQLVLRASIKEIPADTGGNDVDVRSSRAGREAKGAIWRTGGARTLHSLLSARLAHWIRILKSDKKN